MVTGPGVSAPPTGVGAPGMPVGVETPPTGVALGRKKLGDDVPRLFKNNHSSYEF